MKTYLIHLFLVSLNLLANPYPDPNKVPVDPPYISKSMPFKKVSAESLREAGKDIIRVDITFTLANESFQLNRAIIERSGTDALERRAALKPYLGSYLAELREVSSKRTLAYDSVGTGMELRLLTRGMTFRFPKTLAKAIFVLTAENPKTGKMEEVISQEIDPLNLETVVPPAVEVRQLKSATSNKALKLNIYADGYVPSKRGNADTFFKDAQRVVEALQKNNFPGYDQFEIVAVYAPSKLMLGKAKNLGTPVPERDSFLGLYYPYWDDFGRWYNIVYPTSEKKFRDGVGVIPYDYAFVLVDNSEYWGIGNFNLFTAIPSRHPSFTYLLTHEFGHFFGLNEEYESGGKTELAFAPQISEPWSQNITFHPKRDELKWISLVSESTTLPTPSSHWEGGGPWGAYKGGYAQTEPYGKSHKPGLSCIMENDSKFCPVCKEAISKKIAFDLGN